MFLCVCYLSINFLTIRTNSKVFQTLRETERRAHFTWLMYDQNATFHKMPNQS